ncbi:hypothetical protein KL919_001564 [Ogataea angusta]|uniref:O-acyltransferase n=1 Tax=Pichia angusta TaxID=870730 RepID=A0AAN6DJ03_PICAN|nr:uncharacterized protein KL928_001684 [Ogataea angusta]KAG7820247.1 hypothetical protein KL928_001684 [Ogataea angusta]KAG7823931.1 hypothetical protein KL909_002668 [Ogataea angusta]KAG7838484.1 hypothetical protein KL943_000560 [Ogataea angusta]KAG7846940.1 hypothetical protein KL941_002733 [Ogataea angusta]KAG7860784.1 hypothetical protein KL939_001351 [Ogataea angusta]
MQPEEIRPVELKRPESTESSMNARLKIIDKNSGNKRRSILEDDEYEGDSASEMKQLDPRPSTTAVTRALPDTAFRFRRDGSFRSKWDDLTFRPRQSIFDQEVKFGAKFYGLFVAFWFCVFFGGLNVVFNYHVKFGLLANSRIISIMSDNLLGVALVDLLMYLMMYVPVFIQMLVKRNKISWNRLGWVIQSIYEIFFLIFFLYLAEYLNFPWIAKIFLLLHSLVQLMKIHSYAFFNGYLWSIKDELQYSEGYLKKHDDDLADEIRIPLTKSVEFCKFELKAQSSEQPFPKNITLRNFFLYTMYPTLVYQIDYPRTQRIRKGYLFTKIAGIFGVIFLMITISETYLYPMVVKCLELRETQSIYYRMKMYPMIIIEFIPPFLGVYLLVFYLIWELILNAIAELSYFADREFYGYWWNSVDWNAYARDWNIVVHKFLLRHVYHSSISALQLNKTGATIFTFLLSSVVHELAMFVIFKRLRGYLLMLQMSQLPLVQLSKTKLMRDRKVLGNCIFWFGIVLGPSLMCTMYLVF